MIDSVVLDIQRAFASADLDSDQRVFISELFNNPDFSEAQVAEYLGWGRQRVQRTARSLRPDQPAGASLQRFLAAYKKSRNGFSEVLPFQHNNRSRTEMKEKVGSRMRTEQSIENELRRRLRVAQIQSEENVYDSRKIDRKKNC